MTAVAEVEGRDVGQAEPVASARARGPRLSSIFLFVFVFGGVKIGLTPINDNSFMWHLRTGRYMLDTGHIPRGDLYSFTEPGTRWIVQSWLVELLYGAVDRAGGVFGLRLLSALVGGIVGGLIFWIGYRASQDRMRAALLGAAAFGAMLNVWSPRPLMYGILAMLVLVIAIEFPEAPLGRRLYVTLPVLMWLWVNVHGTFMIGFGYLALHLAGRWMEGHPPNQGRERTILRASALAGFVTLFNPYLWDLVLFPVRLMARGEVLSNVQEWQSPNFRDAGAMLFGIWLVVTIVILGRKHPGRRDVLIAVAFSCLGLYAIRNVGLCVVAVLPILARMVRNESPRPDERKPFHRLILAALALLGALVLMNSAAEASWDTSTYPTAAWKNAREVQHLQGKRILTTDKWAGYLILRSYPDQKVFFDDRYDMYSIELNHDYTNLIDLQPGWEKILEKYDFDAIMWPKDGALTQVIKNQAGWKKTYEDGIASIWVREPAR